jgi:hypothetical protein
LGLVEEEQYFVIVRNVEILGSVDFTPLLMEVGRRTEWLMRKIGIIVR